ncbi:MAG: sodium:solute symporter [Flavobacteriales bacterium]|nr:sodium:solute symporter [Flavobacteriales bacterium]
MSPILVIFMLLGYFGMLISISYVTSRSSSSTSFYLADNKSPWFLVAFGMIGASLSGITFISIPGSVDGSHFKYMQMVMGYMLGYGVIALVLLPIYYRLNLVSIYTYLGKRFGVVAHKTGALFFLVSRIIGASLRLFLVVQVLQIYVFDAFDIPFWVTVLVSIGLIWIYTFRGGMKTIIYTDTLQTFFMLAAVFVTIFIIAGSMDLSFGELMGMAMNSEYAEVFEFDWRAADYFPKHFFGGMFIAIAMTGLDQDMMQKNLTCKSIGDAKKNVLWFSIALFFVNILFLALGAIIYLYMSKVGMETPNRVDMVYPMLAKTHLGLFGGIVFLLGLIAAAYSSADSALTSLTTSFCVDFMDKEVSEKKRYLIHLGFSLVVFFVILIFNFLGNESVVWKLFKWAQYTYGPLLGLFAFGIISKRVIPKAEINQIFIVLICIIAPLICLGLKSYSTSFFNGYNFGFELIIINGLLTYVGLFMNSKRLDTQ